MISKDFNAMFNLPKAPVEMKLSDKTADKFDEVVRTFSMTNALCQMQMIDLAHEEKMSKSDMKMLHINLYLTMIIKQTLLLMGLPSMTKQDRRNVAHASMSAVYCTFAFLGLVDSTPPTTILTSNKLSNLIMQMVEHTEPDYSLSPENTERFVTAIEGFLDELGIEHNPVSNPDAKE